jgi:hypothetical protein
MLNVKFLTKSLLVSSFLVSLSPASAMFGISDNDSIDEKSDRAFLSGVTLKKGYELGLEGKALESKDGKKFLVTSHPNFYGTPYFSPYLDKHYNLLGTRTWNNSTCSFDNEFCFSHSEGGGPTQKYNEQTQTWEYDPYDIMPGHEVLNLLVKPVLEEPIKLEKISNKEQMKESNEAISDQPATTATQKSPTPDINSEISKKAIVSSKIETEEKDKKISKAKIFIEPDVNKNASEKNLYVEYNPEKKYYTGMELLTHENYDWWKKRLGYEAYMAYGPEIEFNRRLEMNKTNEQRMAEAESNRAFAEAYASAGIPYSTSTEHQAEEFIRLRMAEGYDEEFEQLVARQPTSSSADYLSAWRGFKYNLDHHSDAPTWVAYVSSKPVENLLCKTMSVTSPDLKLAMTNTMSKSFNFPLGIYHSPIALAFDKESGTQDYRELANPFQSCVARFVQKIDSEIKYTVLRPLKPMATRSKKSGVNFSVSNGDAQEIEFPYIRCVLPRQSGWYSQSVHLTDEEKENFGDSPYILIDPRTDEFYRIGYNHPFLKSPFLGGIGRDKIDAFPFFTVDVKLLGGSK